MNDDLISKILPPPWKAKPRERELSGVQPFFSLRFRGRKRSISRVVAVRPPARDYAAPPEREHELFLGLG